MQSFFSALYLVMQQVISVTVIILCGFSILELLMNRNFYQKNARFLVLLIICIGVYVIS